MKLSRKKILCVSSIVCAIVFFTLPGHAEEMIRAGGSKEIPHVVHIDNVKDLEQIRQSQPQHYKKIQAILTDIQKQTDNSVDKWMQVEFNASDVSYQPMLLVSAPPKRKLAFSLDRIRYEGIIIMKDHQAEILPAR